MRAHLVVAILLSTAFATGTAALSAQSVPPAVGSLPGDTLLSASAPLFTVRDAGIAAGFVGATIALFPVDERISKRLQRPSAQNNRFFRHASKGFEQLAVPGAYIIGGSVYVVGRLSHQPRVADLGLHTTEAVLIATGVTGVLKGAFGRARPYVSADTNSHDFKFGAGFGDDSRRAFPSGHSTTAFAAAAAVTSEVHRSWPGRWWSTWLVGPAMYGGATMVGLARIYHDDHWASDVALGAAVGTFGGMKVVQYSHAHPHNFIDGVLLHTSLVPDGRGGVFLGWSNAAR
ncbi:MAG: phosphatase PAP2 family protein [Gemmatimonadaceae bacterium]